MKYLLVILPVISSLRNPIEEVLGLLQNAQDIALTDGAREQAEFEKYVQWCKDEIRGAGQHEMSAEIDDVLQKCQHRATAFQKRTKEREEELKALKYTEGVIDEETREAAGREYSWLERYGEESRDQINEILRALESSGRKEQSSMLLRLASEIREDWRKPRREKRKKKRKGRKKKGGGKKRKGRKKKRRRSETNVTPMEPVASATPGSGSEVEELRKLVDQAKQRLENEETEEAQKAIECERQKTQLEEVQRNKSNLKTHINSAEAEVESITNGIAVLEPTLEHIRQAQIQNDEVRTNEKAKYREAGEDYARGLHGIKTALEITRKIYGQRNSTSKWTEGLLEVVEKDFERAIEELKVAEQIHQQAYEETKQKNEVSLERKKARVEAMKQEKVQLETIIGDAGRAVEAAQRDLDTLEKDLSNLDCTPDPARSSGRSRDIEILKNARDALKTINFIETRRPSSYLRSHLPIQ